MSLLSCLSSLGVDTWAQVLLPKLIAHGSAQAVASTCSQLRDLCFGSVQHIDLSSVQESSDTSKMEYWVQPIPQHFKNITSMQLSFDEETSYHSMAYLLPALQELPRLDCIKLAVDGDLRPSSFSTVLYSLRTQLKGRVRSIHVDLGQSWVGAEEAWRELGRSTALTELVMDLGKEVEEPLSPQDLLPLANLRNLEALEVCSANPTFFQPLLVSQLALGLTALTYLGVGGCPLSCLAHVSSCTALHALNFYCPEDFEPEEEYEQELGVSEWAALGELTGLVQLRLQYARLLTCTEESSAAISKLRRLQFFGAETWCVGMVSALVACTQLTGLGGGWQQDDSNVESVTLPSVLALGRTSGSPPFAVLPNLVKVQQLSCISTEAFTAMTRHCSRLQTFFSVPAPEICSTLPKHIPDAEPTRVRTAAVTALSALTRLTSLEFMVDIPSELVALVDAVCKLLPHGFRLLKVYVLGSSPVQLGTLSHLAKLQGLPHLCLQLNSESAGYMVQDAAGFLSTLSGIKCVEITGLSSEHVAACKVAQHEIEEAGLPCPKRLTFFTE